MQNKISLFDGFDIMTVEVTVLPDKLKEDTSRGWEKTDKDGKQHGPSQIVRKTDREKSILENRGCAGGLEILMFLVVSVTVSLAWHERRARGAAAANQARPGHDRPMTEVANRLERWQKAGVNWNEHKHSTHTHTDCANPVPVNCSALESLGRHQRAWAASCSELQIPSRLNVDAWPSRLDQPLIHSLGPGNYWVSTEPHAAASNTHAQTRTCTQRGACLVTRMHGMLADSRAMKTDKGAARYPGCALPRMLWLGNMVEINENIKRMDYQASAKPHNVIEQTFDELCSTFLHHMR